MALFKIAWRNLTEHKIKTLIIGLMIIVGITILVIGNSMMDTASRGIEKNYIENFTGDLIITADTESNLTLLGAMDMDSFGKPIPTIPRYAQLSEHVKTIPGVEAVSPQVAGMARITAGEDAESFSILFGIDPEIYLEMFSDNIEIISGDFLRPGKKGILLSNEVAGRIKDEYDLEIKAGDLILLQGFSSSGGAKIRELPVSGIFKFKNSNVQLDMVSLIDIDSLRGLNGMTLGAELAVKVEESETDLIDGFEDEDLFGDSSDIFGDSLIEDVDTGSGVINEENLYSILGDTSDRETHSQVDSGAWHFLLIKLKPGVPVMGVRKALNTYFKASGILAIVDDWKSGAGPMGEMADSLQVAFNILIGIIAVVAVFIIMNTLVISVTERIAEIGTMRALGAQKGFIRKMIIAETTIIAGVSGIIGILIGSLILFILGLTGIPATNMFLEVIFGGKILYPIISLPSILSSFSFIIVVGIIASLYPVSVALKIQPVKAIQS